MLVYLLTNVKYWFMQAKTAHTYVFGVYKMEVEEYIGKNFEIVMIIRL
jgi:hypothetical protein